jgi:phosphate transport system protein
MARETLDNKIRHLLNEILVLDSMVESATIEAVKALKKQDIAAARRVYTSDERINAKRFELENNLITTIATTQPVMGSDLRLMASIMEVNSELERIGDYAKGVAHVCIMLGPETHANTLQEIPRMADIGVDMLHRAIGAFVARDVETARLIPHQDDEVDALYQQVYRSLVERMIADPSTIDRANNILWAAHNLERLADRVTNICERTVYVATGKLEEMARSDDEMQTVPK